MPARPEFPIRSPRLTRWLEPSADVDERRAIGAIFALLVIAFWPTLSTFLSTWNTSYQEHGFFVGGLVAWLVWRDRHRIFETAGPGIRDLFPLLALLSVGWLFAVVMNVRLVHQFLMIVTLTAWALAVFGWRSRVPVLTIGLTFLLGVPLWSISVPILQRATVIASGGATQLAGISAIIGYDYISLSAGTFLVEEGCAGINYLMGGLVLGTYYAHLFAGRWQTQLKIVAMAGAMSIVGNWIRVTTLVFIGEATAMQSGLIDDHLWQGWAIFTLLMVPTYFFARRIERRDEARAGERAEAPNTAVDKERAEALGSNEKAVRIESSEFDGEARATRVRHCVLATLFALTGPFAYMAIGAIPRGADLDRDRNVFFGTETASLQEASTVSWTPDFKSVDDRAVWVWDDGVVEFEAVRHYFVDQRQGEELIQYDNQIAPDSLLVSERYVGPIGPARRMVREAIVRTAEAPRVVWYWYRVGGFDTPFSTNAKLLEIPAFFLRSPASELITVSAACDVDNCTEAATALARTMGATVRVEGP